MKIALQDMGDHWSTSATYDDGTDSGVHVSIRKAEAPTENDALLQAALVYAYVKQAPTDG